MTEELKPCPFCGGKPFTNHRHGGIMGQVYCKNDECFGPRTTALCIEDSARQWNKRPVVVPAQRSAGYELAEEDYKRARDCMASILQEYKKKGCNPLLDSNFDNAFQHAVGIMSLSVRHAEISSISEEVLSVALGDYRIGSATFDETMDVIRAFAVSRQSPAGCGCGPTCQDVGDGRCRYSQPEITNKPEPRG